MYTLARHPVHPSIHNWYILAASKNIFPYGSTTSKQIDCEVHISSEMGPTSLQGHMQSPNTVSLWRFHCSYKYVDKSDLLWRGRGMYPPIFGPICMITYWGICYNGFGSLFSGIKLPCSKFTRKLCQYNTLCSLIYKWTA